MIIQLASDISEKSKESLIHFLRNEQYQWNEIRTQKATYLIALGKKEIDLRKVGTMPGVEDVFFVEGPYQLVSRAWKVHRSTIPLGRDLLIGEHQFQLMLGPCSVENEQQIRTICSFLKKHGVSIVRGGVFKPRSSPYSFQGLGLEGLQMFYSIAREYHLLIITEILNEKQIDSMLPYTDIFQVGARNSQNFSLLNALGEVKKPVLLKRGMSMSLEELLQSAEYIFSHGNENIILCERGIRTFESAYRNTLDLNAIPVLQEKTHLPVVVDPSHGIGIRRHVLKLAYSAILAGADGLLVEIHPEPESALSDGFQSLNLWEAERLIKHSKKILHLRGKIGI